MARIDDLQRQMKQNGVSDLHLTSGSAPYMRIHGDMIKLNYKSVTAETIEKELVTREDGMSFLRRRSAAKQLTGSNGGGNGIRLTNGPVN